jgi:chemotaxis protein MotB
MQRKLALSLAVALAAPLGCVSAGDYEALQRDLAEQKAGYTESLERETSRRKQVEQELEAEKKRAKELEGRIASLEATLASTVAERDRLGGEADGLRAELANVVKDKSQLKSSIDEMKVALEELKQRKAQADQRIAEFKSLIERFQSLIDAGKLRVKIVDGRMVVELATDVLFASGSAKLSKDGQAAIREVAAVLKDIEGRAFQVEGHTDNVPINTAQYPSNWELAAARSLTVVKEMIDAGMPATRVSAAAFGENKPAASNDTKEGKAANRRIEIVVVPDLSGLPGFEELKKVAEN